LDAVEVKGTPAHYSVALGRRPVNLFQIEPAVNFRNYNGRGLQAPGPQNRICKITILAHFSGAWRGLRRGGNIRKTKPVENSFDADPGEINPGAALRLNGQIEDGIHMARSQLLAAASEFSKDAPNKPASERQSRGRKR
jgi:hypothetical protein